MAHSSASYGKGQKLKVISQRYIYIIPIQFSAGFMKDLSKYFTAVTSMRPKATRKESSEIYIIAKDFMHKN